MSYANKSTLAYPITNSFPNGLWLDTRAPTSADYKNFNIGVTWINTEGQDAFLMVGKTATSGTWVSIGGTPGEVETLSGDDELVVSPNSSQNINVLGNVSNNREFSKPLYTKRDNTNTLSAYIQVAAAAASSGSLNAGIASFDSSQFGVDSNGFVTLAGGGEAIDSFAPNSGTNPVVPTAAGLVNMTGVSGMTTVGGTNTLNFYAQTTAKYVVDPTANVGTHQTITAALAVAIPGDTIFIRANANPYIENPPLKAGVNLAAFGCDALTPNVTILGKCTATFVGTCSISGIRLKTNNDYCLSVSGSSITNVILKDCFIEVANHNAVQLSSSSGNSQIQLIDCFGDTDTTGVAYFDNTGAGAIRFFSGSYTNNGVSSTASTVTSSGSVNMSGVNYFDNPITTSGTSNLLADSTNFLKPLIINGTGAANGIEASSITGGPSSSLTVGPGATVTIDGSAINSSNTNAITGTGTLIYSGLTFIGTSSLMNVSTMTGRNINTGGISFDGGNNILSNYIQAGTFTPSIQFGGASTGITYTDQIGEYTRIGNLVFVRVLLTMSNKGSSTGAATMAGFPITAANSGEQCFLCTNTTNITYSVGYQYTYLDTAGTPDTIFDFYQGGSASSVGSVALQDTNFANNARFEFNAVYFADGV